MSKHRIKSLALEDDYDEDYEDEYDQSAHEAGDEDGLTAEDKEQLRIGTVQVRSALGQSSATLTDKEIQDTLWHYYYDIAKSVTYLKNKSPPNQRKQDKPKTDKGSQQQPAILIWRQVYYLASPTAIDFFHDSPWLKIPPHRRAEILIEPVFPRLGLLGGSSAGEGKMSKLAALAAKRRQKENEKHATTATKTENPVKESASGLSNLGIEKQESPNQLREIPLQPRLNLEPNTLLNQIQDPLLPEKKSRLPREQGKDERAEDDDQSESVQPLGSFSNLRAEPSLFARTLVDSSYDTSSLPSEPLASLSEFSFSSFDFSKPSPDDIVLKAQNFKGPTTSAPAKQQKSTKVKESVTNKMTGLSVAEPERIKSKNLDVLAEYRKVKRKNAANFVVIGHVDSGKSTLMGRLLYDLKAIDERTLEGYKTEAEKIGKGSFAFAWILDQGTEERARGVTMDIASNRFETERSIFTILDAPGHRDFVPNMIAGASEADFAVLVIDASAGEFEAGLRGQTKEHALLVRSMGVSKVIVAVNKMDRSAWSEDRFKEIQQQMLAFLTTAGFNKEQVSFVPCSGLQGDNILTRSRASQAAWYSGHTLVEELDTSEPTNHALDKPLRMTIADVFEESPQNPLCVSGRIEAGSLQVGDQVVLMPSGETAFIRNLQVDEEPSDWAVAGQNVILSLTEVPDPVQMKGGDMLCSSASPANNVTSFTSKVLAFDHLTPMPLDIHKGRLHIPGRISKLMAVLNKVDGSITKKRPKIVHPGSVVRVVVELDSPAPIEGGRIIFRSNGETVAAGMVE